MLVTHLRFPLGVYHALGAASDGADGRAPEWPPNPVRLIGALLDAAHGQPGGASDAALSVIDRVASASPPTILAPSASAAPNDGQVAVLTGASRWAPRNPALGEIKDGLSLRDLAGPRAAVNKGGVAIGSQPVSFLWSALELSDEERVTLADLASDVAWLGTSRSPVLVQCAAELVADEDAERWDPIPAGDQRAPDAQVRVPTRGTVGAFDAEFERRRSAKGKFESSGVQKPASAGITVAYATRSAALAHDPEHWGQAYVLELSPESETRPKAQAAYPVARAFRKALLSQFAGAGEEGEAPAILRGRGDTPHAAIVPLSFVGPKHADGLVKGIAVLMPHASRLNGDITDFDDVERAIGKLLDAGGEIRIAGTSFLLREANPMRPLASLDLTKYGEPSMRWATVTPVVHSHWRATKSRQALVDQVVADCRHVGLPAPSRIEVLRNPDPRLRGAPPAFVNTTGVPEDALGPVRGPVQHLRLEFDQPVRGPILLGRARHFGVGLLRPLREEDA